jgi:hypothetical protein
MHCSATAGLCDVCYELAYLFICSFNWHVGDLCWNCNEINKTINSLSMKTVNLLLKGQITVIIKSQHLGPKLHSQSDSPFKISPDHLAENL